RCIWNRIVKAGRRWVIFARPWLGEDLDSRLVVRLDVDKAGTRLKRHQPRILATGKRPFRIGELYKQMRHWIGAISERVESQNPLQRNSSVNLQVGPL